MKATIKPDLYGEITGLVNHINRIRSMWSECSNEKKNELWRELHVRNRRVFDGMELPHNEELRSKVYGDPHAH